MTIYELTRCATYTATMFSISRLSTSCSLPVSSAITKFTNTNHDYLQQTIKRYCQLGGLTQDFRIVEDDIFADLQVERGISLAALDQLNRVTYIGSLSKSISPSLRVGFIACQRDLAREFAQKKMLEGLTSCEISEKLAAIILTEGRHRLAIERLRSRCTEAQRTVATQLENCGMQLFHHPSGGMFLWARFAADIDTAQVAHLAAENALVLAPGRLFSSADTASPWLRFNVGYTDQPQVYRFLEQIAGCSDLLIGA